MINFESLFKITYGLYIVCSGDKTRGNGFISNTVFQVTAEPAKFAACCNKDNFTSELIDEHDHFSVSVLHQKTESEIFGKFGYRSGKDFNKLEGMNIKYGITGAPIILNDTIAYLECKVVQKFDVGTHWLFIGELIDAQLLDETNEPITYTYYRQVKKGVAPKNAPTYIDKSKLETPSAPKKTGKYKCTVCGHIYNEKIEEVKFADLSNSWKCPVCGAGKENFIEV
ncbi:MAG TPA: flavin reductase [Bacteroidales bacterium]|nr:flavin reductase [Bacteroidales bacterium]